MAKRKKRKKPGPKPRVKPVPRALTGRQVKFCHEFPVDFSPTNAARRAGYSDKSAYAQGSALLRNPRVQELLAKQVQKALVSTDIKASDVLTRATQIAFGDTRGFVDDKGCLLKLNNIPDNIEPLIRGFKADPKTGVVTEILIEQRLHAVKLLMQNFGLLKEQLRLEVSSELTREETEIIDAFSDQELIEWNQANGVIIRLLTPPPTIEVQRLLPAAGVG